MQSCPGFMDAVWGCFRLCCGGLCGGSRVRDPDFDAEHEVLLERGANLAELPREQFTESPAGEKQCLLVLRHGERVDEVDDTWDLTTDRPWDPPLTDLGRRQAASCAAKLTDYRIDLVVSSPFARCLETSAQILVQLGLDLDHLIVDGQVSEVCAARPLNLADNSFPPGHLLDWMWKGTSMQKAVKNFISSEPVLRGVPGKPSVSNMHTPTPPETLNDAMTRYAYAFERIADAHPGRNILIVTHGEALRTSINKVLPDVTVYETLHVGFTVSTRQRIRQAKLNSISLRQLDNSVKSAWEVVSDSGACGVNWL